MTCRIQIGSDLCIMKYNFTTNITKNEFQHILKQSRETNIGHTLTVKKHNLQMLVIIRYINNKYFITSEVYEKGQNDKYVLSGYSEKTEITNNETYVSMDIDLGKSICQYTLSISD